MMRDLRNNRIRWLVLIFIIAFLSLSAQLYDIQVNDYEVYAYRAIRQVGEEVPLEEVARGDIVDKNGRSLIDKEKVLGVAIFPSLLEDIKLASIQLSNITGMKESEIEKRIKLNPFFLKLNISKQEGEAIENLGNKGIIVINKEMRYGPNLLASHLIGNLGKIFEWKELEELNKKSNKPYFYDDLVGKSGLEKYYENELKGIRYNKVLRGFFYRNGDFIPGLGININHQKDDERKDIKLTIDWEIQSIVEEIMNEKVKKGSVVVMDVQNGDILAMSSRPKFNPGRLNKLNQEEIKDGAFIDRSLALSPPGSVFKVVVAAAALENNLVQKGTPFYCKGAKDEIIKCSKPEGHGWIPFAKAMAVSCNPTFARVGLKLGPKVIEEYVKKFGLEEQEIVGYSKIDKRQNWHQIGEKDHLVNSLIGQGETLATPVQITSMMNTIAAGGIYQKPRIVQAVIDKDNKGEIFSSSEKVRVISAKTAEDIKDMLFLVTNPGGTGENGYVKHWGSVGKTSSVEINKKKNIVNTWFSGFFPYEQPRYTITVMVEEGISGGKTSAPIFKEIAEKILPYNNHY